LHCEEKEGWGRQAGEIGCRCHKKRKRHRDSFAAHRTYSIGCLNNEDREDRTLGSSAPKMVETVVGGLIGVAEVDGVDCAGNAGCVGYVGYAGYGGYAECAEYVGCD
jgi:hypothetical protein